LVFFAVDANCLLVQGGATQQQASNMECA